MDRLTKNHGRITKMQLIFDGIEEVLEFVKEINGNDVFTTKNPTKRDRELKKILSQEEREKEEKIQPLDYVNMDKSRYTKKLDLDGKEVIKRSYTIQEVRSVLMDLIRLGKREEVKEILWEVGAKKLTDVQTKDYEKIMDKAKKQQSDIEWIHTEEVYK